MYIFHTISLCPWLVGPDQETDSNARSRYILIHESLYPMSEGCITLPIPQYNKLSKFLHSQKGSTIMWAYQ